MEIVILIAGIVIFWAIKIRPLQEMWRDSRNIREMGEKDDRPDDHYR